MLDCYCCTGLLVIGLVDGSDSNGAWLMGGGKKRALIAKWLAVEEVEKGAQTSDTADRSNR